MTLEQELTCLTDKGHNRQSPEQGSETRAWLDWPQHMPLLGLHAAGLSGRANASGLQHALLQLKEFHRREKGKGQSNAT